MSSAEALDLLATKAAEGGDIHEAFWLQEEALAIATRRLAPTDFQRVRYLVHHAEYAGQLGLIDLSHTSYQQAVDLYVTPHFDETYITALLSLAQIDQGRGLLEEARTHAERAVRECDASCRGETAAFVKQRTHETLGRVLYMQGRLNDADRELDEAIRIGRPSPFTSSISNQRAEILAARGQLESALHVLLKVPRAARDTNALARVQARLGDVPAAIATLGQSFEQSLNEIGRFARDIDGEASLIREAANLPGHLGTAVALDEEYGDANIELRALVATMALNRVGLSSALVTDMYLRLRSSVSPQDAEQLREMFRMRSQAALWTRHYIRERPDAEAQIREFSRKARRIEVDLLKKYENAVGNFKILSLTDIATKLPADGALVQILKFAPPTGAAKYRAYIVRLNRATPGFQIVLDAVTLGDARAIDRVVGDFRASLVLPEKSDPDRRRQLAQDAGRLLWDEIGKRLPGSHVMLVPDAGLLSTSFEALRDERGMFVGGSKTVTYLGSARELDYDTTANMVVLGDGNGLNVSTGRPSGPPIVLADPDFGAPHALARVRWDAVPKTAHDAEEIKRRYPDAAIRRGRGASRAALQSIVSPSFLHIGSHAFYSGDVQGRVDILVDNPVGPMLAGGVVLAGANAPGIEDDGIASPVDFAGLDLRGTELVFVSGCSSGNGTVRDSEGLYGMRRALRVAGSRAQILALWNVDQDATSQFVRAFYQAWPGSGSVEDAFKAAQRQVRALWENDPYYWAAFTLSGTPFH